MNLCDDTKKSLGFLKKSLKMSRRAIEKNQNDDGSTDADVEGFQDAVDELLTLINFFEAPLANGKVNAAPPIPAAVPVAPVVPTTATTDPSTLFDPLTITNPN